MILMLEEHAAEQAAMNERSALEVIFSYKRILGSV